MAIVEDLADSIHIIKKIIHAIETSPKLKGVCRGFKEYLWCTSKNLQELQDMPLSDAAVATFKNLKDVLEEAYQVIDSVQKHYFVYLMLNSTRILEQIKEKQKMVANYMSIITLVHLTESIRLILKRTNTNLREQHEFARNGTDAVSNSGCWMAHGVWSCQIALCNQAEFNDDLRIFKFKELKIATDDFKHDRIIGSGAFGIVYKGLVKDSSGSSTLEVAIKRAYSHPSKEDDTELKYLRQISHPNVIKLLGYCVKKDKRKWIRFRQKEANSCLLVSVYMPNGRLSDHLFSGKQEPLSWAQRIKIAIGSARALAYLHECRIIHRDVKSANILLDSDFNSKLADFGSAMDFPTYSTNIDDVIGTSCYVAPEYLTYDKQALELSWAQRIKIANGSARALAYLHECRIIHRDVRSANIVLDSDFNSKLIDFGLTMDFPTYSTDTHDLCGTLAYMAPEYLFYGKISEKIDVYGYGATLLENLSGQHVSKLRPQEFQSPEDSSMSQEFQSPVDLRTNYLQKFIISSTSDLENLNNLMDPRLDGKYPLKAAHLAVQLTLNCVAGDPNKRPSMEEVIKVLEQIQTIKMPSTTLAPDRIISDPCDPLPCDLDFLVSRSMVYESAPFDADAELSFSVPRSMMMSEPAPYDADAELPFSLSKSMVYESAPFDAETELSFPKCKTSHSPIH